MEKQSVWWWAAWIEKRQHSLRKQTNYTIDAPSEVTSGHEAGGNKPVSQFLVIQQHGVLLAFPHSIAHCFSADFKLGAYLAKQIKEKSPSYFRTKKEYMQLVLHAQYLANDDFVFHVIVKLRCFHKPTYRSLRKALLAFLHHMFFYHIDELVFHIYHVLRINLVGMKCTKLLLKNSRIKLRANHFHLQNSARTHHTWWSAPSNGFLESAYKQHWDQSICNLGTNSISSSPFSHSGIQGLRREVWNL